METEKCDNGTKRLILMFCKFEFKARKLFSFAKKMLRFCMFCSNTAY